MADSSTLNPVNFEAIIVKNVYTPTTGQTISPAQAHRQYVLLNPAGALLALTIALPASPNDGDIVVIGSSKAITTLTMTVGGSIIGTLSTMALGGFGAWIYDLASTTWYRIG